MINKYYVRKLKKLLEKNTRYYNKERAGEPLPYIITDEKDYYKIILCVEKLTDKNDITDGLVDILENRVIEQQKILDKIKEKVKEELKEGRPTEEGKPEEYLWLMGYYDAYRDLNELLEEIK